MFNGLQNVGSPRMIVSFEGFLCCVRAKFLSLFVLECSGARKIAFRIDFRRFSIWRLYTDSLFSSAGVQKQTRHSSNQDKTILLVGQKSSTALSLLSSGLTVTSQTHIGNYIAENKLKPITEYVFSIGGYNIKIVDGLPLPSGANRRCRNVEINNIKIANW